VSELSAEQLTEQRDTLLGLRRELQQQLGSQSAGSRPVSLEQPIGRLSRMDALQQQEMAKANLAGLQRRLELIEAALTAIRLGRYGDCRRCEEPIDLARLRARPESPFCLECQERTEGCP